MQTHRASAGAVWQTEERQHQNITAFVPESSFSNKNALVNPLGGCPLRYTQKQSLAGEVTCPLCKSCGRGEADKHGSGVEQNATEADPAVLHPGFFHNRQRQSHTGSWSDWEILAWACSLSWWAQQAVTSASWLQSAGTTQCLIHYSWGRRSRSCSLADCVPNPHPHPPTVPPPLTVICPCAGLMCLPFSSFGGFSLQAVI